MTDFVARRDKADALADARMQDVSNRFREELAELAADLKLSDAKRWEAFENELIPTMFLAGTAIIVSTFFTFMLWTTVRRLQHLETARRLGFMHYE